MDDHAAPVADVDIDCLIDELDAPPCTLPERALRAIQARRDEAIPKLIDVLRKASQEVRETGKCRSNAPFFSIFLLTEFQAKEGLPAIVEAMTLPNNGADAIFGDAISDTWPRALAVLGHEPLELIGSIIADRSLDEFVRWGAAGALRRMVIQGRLARLEAVERLRQFLRVAIDGEDYDIISPLLSELSWLRPVEAKAEIAEAFEKNMVDLFTVNRQELDESLNISEGEMIRNWDRPYQKPIVDTVEELKGWAAFQPRDSDLAWQPPLATKDAGRHFGDENFGDENFGDENFGDENFGDENFGDEEKEEPDIRASVTSSTIIVDRRPGRNERCPCGSGKKYKKCCGARGKS